MSNIKETPITLNEIGRIDNELGKSYTFLNEGIISRDRNIVKLIYPNLDGKMHPTAYASVMCLRDEIYALRNACNMAMATLNRVLDIEE